MTLESTLYGMINEGHVTIKDAEQVAKKLLDSMETGPEGYDCVENETVNKNSRTSSNNNNEGDTSPVEPTTASAPAVVNESGTQQPGATANHDKWAAPRFRAGGSYRPGSSNQEEKPPRENERASSSAGAREAVASDGESATTKHGGERTLARDPRDGASDERSGDRRLSLGLCLGRVLETHRRACMRYANQVAELEAKNAGLAAAAAEASRLEVEAAAQTRLWEAKHEALEERLAEVEKRSREELARAENFADEARSQALEAANQLTETLERATPTLLELVAGFAPRDTEGPGVHLFRSLGVDPDLYVHLLATKRMFEVRAWDELVASGRVNREPRCSALVFRDLKQTRLVLYLSLRIGGVLLFIRSPCLELSSEALRRGLEVGTTKSASVRFQRAAARSTSVATKTWYFLVLSSFYPCSQADLESRAFEVVEAERKIALAEAEAALLEEAANAGGKKKKGERGRPKSRGKGAGGADKGKSGGSKSRSRSAAGKGMKKSSEKSSSKTAEKGASKDKKKAAGKGAKTAADKPSGKAEGRVGKENKEAGKKPSSVENKRSQSPAKKGGAGKGGKKKK